MVGIVGAIVVAAVILHGSHRTKQREAFETAKIELEACLLGPEPLAAAGGDGFRACNLRVRRRQLVAMATPIERRIDEGLRGWPMRCSEPSKRMMRKAIELEDLPLQTEVDRATSRLATMTALSAPIDLMLCLDESGQSRAPHLSKATASSLPPLAAPLDLDALIAHAPPALAAKNAKELEETPHLAALLPEGYREVGSVSKASSGDGDAEGAHALKAADGETMMVDLDWPGVIYVSSCEGSKCRKRIVARETFDLNDPELRASDSERFRPARVGGSILAVWRGGARGGLRMRVAPIDQLAVAHDVVLFDDLVRDGILLEKSSTLEAFRVYGGAHVARICLVTLRGTWIIDVDERGAFSLPGAVSSTV